MTPPDSPMYGVPANDRGSDNPDASSMPATPRPRLAALPRYLSATLSQGLVSGFHFVLNLTLVKLLAVADFGVFALTFVLAIMMSSISNALVGTPLSVFAAGASDGRERARIESLLTTAMMLILGIVLTLGGATVLFSLARTPEALPDPQIGVAALGFVIAYLARQYSRSFGYSRFDVIAVLRGDVVYVTTGASLMLLAVTYLPQVGVVQVLTILTLANALAILTEIARLPVAVQLMRFREACGHYKPLWKQTRWALIGSLTTVLVSQAHSVVVTALEGAAAFAPLAAGFVLFGPVRVVFTTIQNVIKPEMSLAISEHRAEQARRQMLIASALSMLSVASLILLTLVFWQPLSAWLYAEHYSDAPMRQITLLWGAVTLVAALQNGPFAALQSLRAFKPLAMVTVYGSMMSLMLVTLCVWQAPEHWSIGGIMFAEAFVAGWVIHMSLTRFNRLGNAPDHGMNPTPGIRPTFSA